MNESREYETKPQNSYFDIHLEQSHPCRGNLPVHHRDDFPCTIWNLALIRSVLIRLLPIVTGFLLAVTALAINPPAIGVNSEIEDELERDPYTAPLYVLPDEESYTDFAPILEPAGPSLKQQSIVESTLSEVVERPPLRYPLVR